jgi:hypothetical protein
MRGSMKTAGIVATALAVLLSGAPNGQAQLVSSVESKCSSSMGKSAAKLAKIHAKSVASCRDADISGKTVGTCPDSKGATKISSTQSKLTSSVEKKCKSTCSVSGLECVSSALCPPLPSLGASEACSAGAANQPFDYRNLGFPGAFCEAAVGGRLSSGADIATCVNQKTSDASDALINVLYGSLTNASSVPADAANCLKSISKAAQKLAGTIHKGVVKCRSSILAGKVVANPATCTTDDAKLAAKISTATSKLEAAIGACSDTQIAQLDICLQGPGGVTTTALAVDCLVPAVSQIADSNLNPADRLYSPSTLIEASYPPGPACGDGVVNQVPSPFFVLGEECDLGDDDACPGDCLPPGDLYECTCGGSTTPRVRYRSNGFTADLDNGWSGTSHNSSVTDKAGFVNRVSNCDCDDFDGPTCVGTSVDPICDLNGRQMPRCSWDPNGPQRCEALGIDLDNVDDDDDCWICDEFAANAGAPCINEGNCTGQCYPLAGGAATGTCPNGQGDCGSGEICRGQCDRTPTCIILPNGAPLPLSSGGTAVCVLPVFRDDIYGTLNIQTGEHELFVRQFSKVHLGVSNVTPCPTCGGFCASGFLAGTPCEGTCSTTKTTSCRFDDDCPLGETCTSVSPKCGSSSCNLSLVCNGGPNDKLPCRISAPTAQFGTTSTDCPPSPGQNISGNGLEINYLPQTSELLTLPYSLPCTAPGFENFDCACPGQTNPAGLRSQPSRCGFACNAGAEFGIGCGSGFGAINGFPTVCVGGSEPGAACDEDSDCSGGGTCTGNPTHCLGGDNSQNRLPCATNADCSVSGGTCTDACPSGRCVQLCLTADDPFFPDGFGRNPDDPEEGLCAAGPPTFHCSGEMDNFRTCFRELAEGSCPATCSISGIPCGPLTPCPDPQVDGVCKSANSPDSCTLGKLCEAGPDGILGNTDDFPGAGICVSDARNCHLNPLIAEGGDTLNGDGDPENVKTVAMFCIAATGNNSINSTAGLGGPGRLRQTGQNVTNGFTSLP